MGAGAPAGTKTNSPLLMHKLQPKQNRRGPRAGAGAAEGGGGRERAERGRQRDRDINKPLQRTKIKIETSGEPGGRGTVTVNMDTRRETVHQEPTHGSKFIAIAIAIVSYHYCTRYCGCRPAR